jgi:hypothetical protein
VIVLKPSLTVTALARCGINVNAAIAIALAHLVPNFFGNVATRSLFVRCFFAARRNFCIIVVRIPLDLCLEMLLTMPHPSARRRFMAMPRAALLKLSRSPCKGSGYGIATVRNSVQLGATRLPAPRAPLGHIEVFILKFWLNIPKRLITSKKGWTHESDV